MNDKYIVHFVSKTKKKMINFIDDKLKENKLDEIVPSYGNILTVLFDNDGKLTMRQIGELVGKDKSTITSLVNKLVKLGYVEKQKSEKDKRVTFVLITQKGRNIEEKFNGISKQVLETAYKDFTLKEKKELLRLLKKLNNNFEREK